MRRLAPSLALVVPLAGCLLPERNNAHDPKNAPHAELQILAVAPDALGCPDLPSSFEVGHSFPRSWCIYLDARLSEGGSIGYSISAPDGELVATLGTGADFLLIPQATLFSLEVGEAYAVSVTAKNGGGGTAVAVEALVVENERPLALTGPSLVLPEGGFPWTPGVSFTVTFRDGGSRDPESDPMTWCWDFSGPGEAAGGSGEICSSDPDDAQFTRTVPVTGGRTVGRLRTNDGAAESLPDVLEVLVGDRALWASGTSAGPPTYLDAERRAMRLSTAGVRSVRWGAPLDGGAERRVAVLERRTAADEEWLVVMSAVNGEIRGEVLVGEAFSGGSLAADSAGSRIWTMRLDSSTDQWLVDAFDVIEGVDSTVSFAPALPGTAPVPVTGEGSDDVIGTLWFVPPFLDTVARISPDGTTDILTFPGRRVGTASPRPGTSETWVTNSPDFVNGATGETLLETYQGVAAAPSRTWELPGQFAHSIRWISSDHFWMGESTLGVLLVDAALLDAGFTFEESILVRASDYVSSIYIATDFATGTALALDVFGSTLHRIAVDGTVDDLSGGVFPLFYDANGALWQFDGNGNLVRSRDSTATGEIRRLSVFSNAQPSVDLLTGGLWTYSQFPSAFLNVAPDGRILRTIEAVDADGILGAPQSVRQLRTAFDGTWGVVRTYGTNELSWLDLSVDPPALTSIPDPASGFLLAARPSSPVNATRFIWTLTSAGEVYQAPLLGALPAPVFTFTERAKGANVIAAIAPSMEDGSLCLLTVQDDADPTTGPSTVRLRRIAPNGTVTLLVTTGQAPSSFLDIGTASTGVGASAVCWLVLSDLRAAAETTLVAGLYPNQTIANAVFSAPGMNAESFSAVSNDTLWLTERDPVEASTRLVRLDWNGLQWERFELDTLEAPLRLTSPNSSLVSPGFDELNP